ncbi:MAG TPA: UPF0182 family protein [Gemmatimonadales bacterium]|nr:UPF0182 family protein [Gemmatimonadales bacterium]
MSPSTRRIRLWLILLAAVVLALIVVPSLAGLLTDWWWFREVGFQVVFTRSVLARGDLFLAGFAVTALILHLNLRVAQRGIVLNPVVMRVGPSTPQLDVSRSVRRASPWIVVVLAFFAGLAATSLWDVALAAMNRTPFGVTDPVFGRDVGFYVFTLPALAAVLAYLFALLFLALLLLLVVYALRGAFTVRGRAAHVERRAGIHLAAVLAALFLVAAAQLWLVDASNLLYSTTGPLVGASYTDLHASLPALRLCAVAAVAAAAAVLVGGLRERLLRHALFAIGGYAAIAVLGRGLVPLVMQKFVVAPTELTRETPYLRAHIAATRAAWGLDGVEVRDLGSETPLTLATLRANTPTIENVRLWERDPLLQTFGQLQEIRTYYDFVSVDDDRYWIDGKYRQILLSPRELNPASLPTRTFINEHLTFTHGMGLTLGPVNQSTAEGLPVLFVKDLPPTSSVSLNVTRPQIYYGELDDDYAFVGTRQREFDYPSGDADVYAAYTGTGGVRVGNVWRKLLLAVRFGSSNVLFSQDITSDSRALYNREILGRAQKALPFLTFDPDPYLVITPAGRLEWILDGYTSTDRYPYAQRLVDGTSYMRNSVKVVIDAYDGSLKAFVSAPADPLVRTWARVFPGILAPLDSFPADLKPHLRYPDQIYRIQTGLYATYHMDAPVDFYHREDQWQIPIVNRSTGGAVPFMRHIIMKLPGEAQEEYVYMVPFTPRGKDNLAAWMVARNDGAEYGKLRVYRLSRQTLVFGPTQIENRINQNTEISQQVSLWDQHGSQVIWGDLLVIPIGTSLLYVQPLYLRAAGGKIPELKRVVVAYQNEVAMAETLDGALSELFGGSAGPRAEAVPAAAATSAGDTQQALVAEARQHYADAMAAQRAGDWARYGEEIKALGGVLERLGAARGR